MGLQYLDALKSIGASASSKFIFPMEFTSLLKPFIEPSGESRGGDESGARPSGEEKAA
jgi:hypothetical protein